MRPPLTVLSLRSAAMYAALYPFRSIAFNASPVTLGMTGFVCLAFPNQFHMFVGSWAVGVCAPVTFRPILRALPPASSCRSCSRRDLHLYRQVSSQTQIRFFIGLYRDYYCIRQFSPQDEVAIHMFRIYGYERSQIFLFHPFPPTFSASEYALSGAFLPFPYDEKPRTHLHGYEANT